MATMLAVVAGDGIVIRILELQPEGRRGDDGARVPRRAAGSRRARDRAGMIAPARLAAYDVAAAGRHGTPGSAAGAGACPVHGSTTNAIARLRARSPPAPCAGRRRSITSSSAATGRPLARLDPEVLDILRLTLFQLLHLDRVPGVRGGRRRREPDQARPARAARRGLVNAVLRRMQPRTATSCRCQPGPRDTDRQRGASARTCRSRCRIRAGWSDRWLRPVRLRGGRSLGAFNNSPAPLTLRVNTPAERPREAADRRAGAGRRARRAWPLRARTGWSCSTAIRC